MDRRIFLNASFFICLQKFFGLEGVKLHAREPLGSRRVSCLKKQHLKQSNPLSYVVDPPNLSFDKALRGSPLSTLSGFFEAKKIRLLYFDDIAAFGSNNALHITGVDNVLPSDILVGAGLVRSLLSQPRGDIALLAVIAHEFAHEFQTSSKSYALSIKNSLTSHELHADALAGAFLGFYLGKTSRISLQGVVETWQSWDVSSITHGSRKQRATALQFGFDLSLFSPSKSIEQISQRAIKSSDIW